MDLPHHFTVFLQLAEGLGYIHSKNLIHQDINPENVLISVDSKGKITMKLADFGLSKSVNERGSNTMNSGLKGTNKWLAPELLQKLMKNEETIGRGTVKSDVFAWASSSFLILKGHHLYGSNQIGKMSNCYAHDDRISSGDGVIQFKKNKTKGE
jgi:serine/threonine protein kinase